MKCTICENSSDGYHFNVISCRACSSFFRRTLAENKTYVCRKDNSCNVSFNYRNICRACRLRRCYEVGMKRPETSAAELQQTQQQPQPSPPDAAAICKLQCIPSISIDSTTHLKSVYLFWHGYLSSLKSLYTVENPSNIFANIEYKLITQSEYDKVEEASMSIMFSLLQEHILPFKRLTQEQKISTMKNVARSIAMAYKTSLTAIMFPNDSNKFVMNFGYYIDRNNLEHFFEHKESSKDVIKLLNPVVCQVINLSQTFQGYREVEVGLISIMFIAQNLRKNQLSNDEDELFWRDLLAEAHAEIISHYGFHEGGIRFADLLLKVSTVNDIQTMMSESTMIIRIFSPENFVGIWEHTN